MILTVVNTNNSTSLSKGRAWGKWSLSQHCIIFYNRETHDGLECIYTYIISQIILYFYVKYSDRIWTPTSPLRVNTGLFWMRSLMHTASSGKAAYASMCHLGLCVLMYFCVCTCVIVYIQIVFVCFSVCNSSSHRQAYGCLIACVCVCECVYDCVVSHSG